MAKDEFAESQAALRRKADALEEAGGDPAKVAELRHLAPVERSARPKVTVEDAPKEKAAPKVEEKAKEPDKEPEKLGHPVKATPGRPRKETK